MRSHANPTPWSTLLFALLGLAWCGYVAFPTATPPPCATSGCALFRDTKFIGLSLWWVGGAYFFLMAIICLRGNRHLARILALLALLADTLLLLIMFLTAPCFDCLVVAALLGLGYYSLRGPDDGWFTGTASPSLLLPIWFGLFLGNSVLAGNEILPLHTAGTPANTEVRVFFSPSCPACREALGTFGDKAALYPVMENESDFEAIIRFEALLQAKLPVKEALDRSLDPAEPTPALPFTQRKILEMQLMRNKAALLRQGFRALPLIQINGMPGYKPTSLERANGISRPGQRNGTAVESHGLPPAQTVPADLSPRQGYGDTPPAHTGGADMPDFLQGFDTLQKCGGDNAEPCDEPVQGAVSPQ